MGSTDNGARRLYYNQRAGAAAPRLSFEEIRTMVAALYTELEGCGWFQATFGYECVDIGYKPGDAGRDPEQFIFRRTWLRNQWPMGEALSQADQTVLFTLIEFLFDCVSRPLKGTHHTWNDCGWHFNHFDQSEGQERWCCEINEILRYYGGGFELSKTGEVNRLGHEGVRELLIQPAPASAPSTNRDKLEAAVRRYRHFNASRQDRIAAVRDLVDVLEYYRPEIKRNDLSKDEADLFNIANNFAIRHNRPNQRAEYGDDWLDWLFHLYLSTVHLTLRLVHGADPDEPEPEPEPEPESNPFPF